jgi:hypothetical protein
MNLWKKILSVTAFTLIVGGIYLFTVWKHRQNPGVVGQPAAPALSQDDLAVVRTFEQQHYEDVLRLQGTSLWMKNGYTIPYYHFKGGHIDFAHPVGLIPPGERLDVKKVVKAPVPSNVDDSIGHGSRQVFLVFALATPAAATDLFATPTGVMDGAEEQYYCDMLYFYDDPHSIYTHWSKDMWAAIEAHQVKPGMSEMQTRMSIGQKIRPEGEQEGDRTVVYTYAGKKWTIAYEKDHATSIRTE